MTTKKIWKDGDYQLHQEFYTKSYAVFKKCGNDGAVFYQQITKWYVYRKCCERAYRNLKRGIV